MLLNNKSCFFTIVTALIITLGSISTACAAVIYHDPMTEYLTGTNLNGQVPGPTGNAHAWIAPAGSAAPQKWVAGPHGVHCVQGTSGATNAFLPFTPKPGYVYTLQATFTVRSSQGNWAAVGFLSSGTASQTTAESFNAMAASWMLTRGSASGGADQVFAGPGTNGMISAKTRGTTAPVTMTITLTTYPNTAWTVAWSYTDAQQPTNSSIIATHTYSVNPNITAVGFGQSGTNTTVRDFRLTASPIHKHSTE